VTAKPKADARQWNNPPGLERAEVAQIGRGSEATPVTTCEGSTRVGVMSNNQIVMQTNRPHRLRQLRTTLHVKAALLRVTGKGGPHPLRQPRISLQDPQP